MNIIYRNGSVVDIAVAVKIMYSQYIRRLTYGTDY